MQGIRKQKRKRDFRSNIVVIIDLGCPLQGLKICTHPNNPTRMYTHEPSDGTTLPRDTARVHQLLHVSTATLRHINGSKVRSLKSPPKLRNPRNQEGKASSSIDDNPSKQTKIIATNTILSPKKKTHEKDIQVSKGTNLFSVTTQQMSSKIYVDTCTDIVE